MAVSLKILSFVLLHAVLFYNSAEAAEAECKKCHQETYDQILKFQFQHSGFVTENCKGCHVSGEYVSRSSLGFSNETGRNSFGKRSGRQSKKGTSKKFEGKIIRSSNYSLEHMAILENLKISSPYQMKIFLSDLMGKKNESDMITFTPKAISEFWVDDEVPPSISGVRVKQVDISTLTSAEIEWRTDKFSNSKVEYGLTEKYGSAVRSPLYNKKHVLKLGSLRSNKKYFFRVISRDPFGNESVSDNQILDTSKAFKFKDEVVKGKEDKKPKFQMLRILKLQPKKKENKNSKNSKSRKFLNKAVVFFSVSREVAYRIEYIKEKKGESYFTDSQDKTEHGGWNLKNGLEAGIDTCLSCHSQGASHPVGVAGSLDVQIPKDLPTADRNVMTCVTCHTPHGGDSKYLARIDFRRDLCVLCHIKQL